MSAMEILDSRGRPAPCVRAVGRPHGPERGLGAALRHIVTGAVARTLIRRSERPVVMVPDVVGGLR